MSSPERTCIACRCTASPKELTRWIAVLRGDDDTEDRTVMFDLYARAPGRGVWLCPKASCLRAARRKGGFHRAFRCSVQVPEVETLLRWMEDGLRKRFTLRLGLARRAGSIIAGENSIAPALKSGQGRLLVLASDLSEGSRKKQIVNAKRKGLPVAEPGLPGEVLGGCIGRGYAGLILVTANPFASELHAVSLQLTSVGD